MAHGTDGLPTPTAVWTEGDPVTNLDGGFPLAFFAGPAGTQTVVRYFAAGSPTVFDDVLHDDAGVRLLTKTNGPIAYTSLDSASIEPCVAEDFDPQGSVLTLTGTASGLTVKAGAQTFEVPLDGSNDVSWCSVTSDGQTVHVAWLERGDRHGHAPTPRMLHHVTILNGVQHAAPKVDIAVELLEP